METKTGTPKLKNNDVKNDATDRPVYLNNETNLDVAIFYGASSSPTAGNGAGAASTIVPDTHIPLSGQKQHTNPFIQ